MNVKTSAESQNAKPVYSKPTLTTYGSVVELTAAGSSGVAEGVSSSKTKLKP